MVADKAEDVKEKPWRKGRAVKGKSADTLAPGTGGFDKHTPIRYNKAKCEKGEILWRKTGFFGCLAGC